MKKTRNWKILIFVSIVILALAAGLILLLSRLNSQTAAVGAAEIVEVEVLSRQEGIEISGNIEPVNSADMAFPAAGYISEVYVGIGDRVGTGDIVALLEDSQQRYNLAEVDVELDTEQISGTRRNVDLLNLKKEMMQSALNDTRLVSAMDGIVTEVNAEAGDYVTAQQAGSEKDIIVRVIDRSSMIATVEVDELDAPYLREGQAVLFQFDAYPELRVEGIISQVPLEARQTTQGIAVLDTEVSIPEPPDEILPNFTFAGEIFLADEEEILLIPENAVQQMGERTLVFLVTDAAQNGGSETENASEPPSGSDNMADGYAGEVDGTIQSLLNSFAENLPEGTSVRPVPVTVSKYGSGKVHVLSGLSAGDRIVLPVSASLSAETSEEDTANVMDILGVEPPGGGPPGGP